LLFIEQDGLTKDWQSVRYGTLWRVWFFIQAKFHDSCLH